MIDFQTFIIKFYLSYFLQQHKFTFENNLKETTLWK